jgi:hypothetical protein
MQRTLAFALAVTLVATTAAGCAGTANTTPSSTQLTSATSNPTVEPAAGPTPTPTPGSTLIPYPGPSIPPGTLIIEIGAELGLKFDRTTLTAPPNTPFVIAFDNRANLPPLTGNVHNVLFEGKSVQRALIDLLAREQKDELADFESWLSKLLAEAAASMAARS